MVNTVAWMVWALFVVLGLANGDVDTHGQGEKLKNIDVMCTKSHAIITYIGDPKAVMAFGENGPCKFDALTAEAKFILIATFSDAGPNDCLMKKHPRQNIYHIEVQARFTAPDMEAEGDQSAILSCNFEIMLSSQADTIMLEDPVVMPIIVEDAAAPKAESDVTLKLHYVDGGELPEESVVGTKVELNAQMEPAPNEVAFEVLLCYADMPEAKLSIPVIVDGCGTGHPFPEDRGFVRYSLLAKSPSFGLFRAAKTREVQFRCEFRICPDDCNMYSCPVEREEAIARHRRSTEVEVTAKRIWAKTETHRVFLRGEARKKRLEYNDLVTERNGSDPHWNRLVNEDVQTENSRKLAEAFPQNLLILIIVGGAIVFILVGGAIWFGWRYVTRSVDLPVTPRRVSRDISHPRPIYPMESVDAGGPFYDLSL